MSNGKKIIAIYENLPLGGARSTYENTSTYLKKLFAITLIHDPKYKISNFIQYLFVALVISQKYQREIIHNTEHDILLVYHSWLVKTPSILRYSNKPKIYICHEPMREYYDKDYKCVQSTKEKIVNFLRLPIKYLDRINVKSNNVTFVANSYFSKKIIDKTYNVNSIVIYPGIKIKDFKKEKGSTQEYQVVCVSSINKLKRQGFLVEVIAKLPENMRPTLVLIGNGVNKEYLKYVLDKAKLLGVVVKVKINITNLEKIHELYKSKVFMYSPINEPFGIVIEEALAAGLPVLTYSHGGGYNEIIDSKNGIILDSLDPLIWSKNLELLLTNNDLIMKFRKHNYLYATKYLDSEIMNKKITKLIKQLI